MKKNLATARTEIAGKTCLLRINLDIKEPRPDSWRIETVIPTVRFLLDNGARPIIISHRGRPGNPDPKLSLKPAIEILQNSLSLIYRRETSIEWLENLRFDPREQANDDGFARELAARADFFVNDDFAASHRACASLVAIAKHLPSYAGLLLEKEIAALSRVRDNPEQPLVVIIGGIKIEDKISVIENLAHKNATFLIGGAYTMPREIIPGPGDIILPKDWHEIDGEKMDIGPQTIARYREVINNARTIIWAGPVGAIERDGCDTGSRVLAEKIIKSGAYSVVGGGDTVDFLTRISMRNQFSFVSTGGGALLIFLANKSLPGIEALL